MAGEKNKDFTNVWWWIIQNQNNIVSGIDSIFRGFSSIDEDFYEEIEEDSRAEGDWDQHHKCDRENLKQRGSKIKEPAECSGC